MRRWFVHPLADRATLGVLALYYAAFFSGQFDGVLRDAYIPLLVGVAKLCWTARSRLELSDDGLRLVRNELTAFSRRRVDAEALLGVTFGEQGGRRFAVVEVRAGEPLLLRLSHYRAPLELERALGLLAKRARAA